MDSETKPNRIETFVNNTVEIQQQIGNFLPKREKRVSQQLPITKPVHPKIAAALFVIVSLITFLFVVLEFFIFDIPNRAISGGILTLNIVLMSLFGAQFLLYILVERYPALVNFLIFLQTTILITLMAVNLDSSADIRVLVLPLSAMAAFFLPVGNAIFWLALFFIVGAIHSTYLYGFEEMLSYAASLGEFSVFGIVGALMRRSNQAYYSIESLYDELHDAHTQLTRYSEGVRQLAVSQERNRVAREMHDSLGHSLTVAVVQLEGAERLIPKDPNRAASIIHNMRDQLKQALAELRNTLAQLRSDDGDEVIGNLAMALTELKTNFTQATGLEIELDLPDHLPELNEDQRHAIFRATQEGLTNVQRHANGSRAWVTLTPNRETIALTVSDNGQGFPKEIADGRFGLRGLQERADFFGGSVTRKNKSSGGGELTFTIPYDIPKKDER